MKTVSRVPGPLAILAVCGQAIPAKEVQAPIKGKNLWHRRRLASFALLLALVSLAQMGKAQQAPEGQPSADAFCTLAGGKPSSARSSVAGAGRNEAPWTATSWRPGG